MAFTQDFFTSRRNKDDGETRIGEKDRLWYSSSDNTIRIGDGETPGGVVVGGGSGGGNYTLPTATTTVKGGVKIDGSTITISNQVISVGTVPYANLSGAPTAVSEFTNDSGYVTSSALSTYATQTYVTTRGYITSASIPSNISTFTNDSGYLTEDEFDLNTIDYDSNNNLHATGILPGDTDGFTAIFAGRAAGIAALPNTVIQSQAQINDYAQNNFQNTFDGNHSSTEWVATSPNGDDSNYYIDVGINGASWDGTASNSLYTNAGQRDGWVYVQGGNAGGGNLILGTSLSNTYTKIISGDASAGDTEVARFSSTEVKLSKQLTFDDNTTQTTAWTGTVDWNDVTNTPTILTTLDSLDDVTTSGATDGQVLKYNASLAIWQPAADLVGSGGSGIGLSDLSASNASASGGGSLSYNNTSGVFTFTPPDLSSYVTSSSLSSTLSTYATQTYVTTRGYITGDGNAATATKLGTARAINGVNFDGSAAITITASTPNYLSIGSGLVGTSSQFNGSTAVTIAIDQTVALKSNTTYVGTTSIALNRSSASQTLTGVSIDGNAATVTNGVYTTGTYANPAWITSLAYSKLTGTPTLFSGSYNDLTNKPTVPTNVSQLTNDSGYATLTGIETLTNKTLTLPTIGGTGATFNGSTSGTTVLKASATAGTTTITLPATTGTLITTGDTGTVTNTMLAGSIANAKLSNSSVTVGTTAIALGSSSTTLAGLTSVTSTSFVGALTGNASTVTNGVYTTDTGTVTNTMLAGSIANAKLSNSSVTINGTSVSLGASATVTAAAGTLTGTTLNSSVVTSSLTSVGTLTGLTVSGSSGNSITSSSGGTFLTLSSAARLGSTQTWKFTTNNNIGGPTSWIEFPDSTLQSTAYTGNAATVTNGVYTTDTGTVTNTMLAGSIANNKLTNSSITINSTSVSLGGSITGIVTTSDTGTVTNTMLAGSIANNKLANSSITINSTAVSLGSSITGIVTTSDTGTVTNTMLAGSIANAKLLNSSVTINGTSVSLGASATVTAAAGTLTGTTLNSTVVTSSLTSVGTLTGVTSNAATAFTAGDAAISGVALQIPREGALRNLYNGTGNNMYFDVSIGGTSNGQFQFRSSSSFTNVLTMSPTAFNVNTDAVVTARTPSFGRLPWNSAIDTELTVDSYRFRISNQGGIFPQIISNVSGQTVNSAWTAVGAISGGAITQVGSTGTLVPNNAWTTLYSSRGMDNPGDTVTVTLQDKQNGRIYRITFMRSDNGSTTGYNIIGERLL